MDCIALVMLLVAPLEEPKGPWLGLEVYTYFVGMGALISLRPTRGNPSSAKTS